MKIGVVILCRFDSSRLPGKILKKINGKVALQHTYDRLTGLFDKKDIVVATSTEDSDDKIETYCAKNDIKCYRGDLLNVAQRFCNAATFHELDYAFRVNGDNILLDLTIFEEAMRFARIQKYDFISNVKNRTYPKGMSVELLRIKYFLSVLPEISRDKNLKEHVTLFLYESEKGNYHFIYNKELPEAQGIDLALDTEEDFHVISKIITLLGSKYSDYGLEDIFHVYEQLER